MLLKEVLFFLDIKEIEIEFRTLFLNDKEIEDLLLGWCKYIDGQLISEDFDRYSLNAEVTSWKKESDNHLVVWVKTEWIIG